MSAAAGGTADTDLHTLRTLLRYFYHVLMPSLEADVRLVTRDADSRLCDLLYWMDLREAVLDGIRATERRANVLQCMHEGVCNMHPDAR